MPEEGLTFFWTLDSHSSNYTKNPNTWESRPNIKGSVSAICGEGWLPHLAGALTIKIQKWNLP